MPSPVADALSALRRAFERLDVRWYVFGAQAVVAHGRPRLTEDIDVTVDLDVHSNDDLVRALETEGFRLAVPDDPDFVRLTRVIPVVHESSQVPCDVVLAGPGLEQQFLSRATPLDLGGVRAPVISPSDLVVTKILAARPKDVSDARGVIVQQAEAFDADGARALLAALEEALGQSDLVPVLERLLAETRR